MALAAIYFLTGFTHDNAEKLLGPAKESIYLQGIGAPFFAPKMPC